MAKKIRCFTAQLFLGLSLSLFLVHVSASDLTKIQQEGDKKLVDAEKSQQRIDRIVEGAQERLNQYRALLKQIEGLKAYNEQLATQIKGQEDLLRRFDISIAQVALIERQITPLVSKMAESLDEFISIDLPFHTTERKDRMAFVFDNIASADINVAEKFRQIIEAYQIENEYGRKIDTYQAIVELGNDGKEYEVDVLRIGRIAMVSQTKDTKISAVWNNTTQTWDVLDNVTYRNAIRNGIKMAKKQASIDIVTLPISAPEIAQ